MEEARMNSTNFTFPWNHTFEEIASCWVYSPASKQANTIYLSVLLVFGIPANLLVVFVVCAKRVPRRSVNTLIANMAISDILTLIIRADARFHAMRASGNLLLWFTGDGIASVVLCKVYFWILHSIPFVSLFTLLVISLERYRAVSSIRRVLAIPRCVMVSLIAASWVVPGFLHAYELEALNVFTHMGISFCVFNSEKGTFALSIARFVVVAISSAIIIFLNVTIVKKLRTSQVSSNLPAAQLEKRLQLFNSVIKIIITSLVLFLMSILPKFIFTFYVFIYVFIFKIPHHQNECLVHIFLSVCNLLVILNSVISPLIYFLFLNDFSNSLKFIKCGKSAVMAPKFSLEARDNEAFEKCSQFATNTTATGAERQ
ncbi:predicted protein [Nematostella vectensis]|uniref:G-protein coupled receptors family 1 profile domain-containing protein n=1 Tax=Nematostella vectensis TaxID=45351 RepID=A7SK68_NEMVE|nr:predicted protein [Nematostella vectensis]|eukprot:XP_001627953.1 predicted protein [Nematostella vectensis]